ncbi:MAG: dUTP diphosphatase [Clostridia bacterium]|nr:dUTP diphosphatase [Clostridia bacterium]
MIKVAKFYKISKDNYFSVRGNCREEFEKIKLPERATVGSAGYDFYAPYDFELYPGESAKIPTGIRVKIIDGWALLIYPRSGLGFKYRLQLDNTVGIIDSDYFYSDNEGHIFIKITNDSREEKVLSVKCGDAFAQGVFMPFGITEDDEVKDIRNGGFGSTTKVN